MTDPLAPVLESLARYERESCPAELAAVDQTEADICGVEWRSADTGAVWASYWAHSQDPAHR